MIIVHDGMLTPAAAALRWCRCWPPYANRGQGRTVDLSRTGLATNLQAGFMEMSETVQASARELPSRSVDRDVSAQRDAGRVRDPRPGFADRAETEVLQPAEHEHTEPVIQRGNVDVVHREIGALPDRGPARTNPGDVFPCLPGEPVVVGTVEGLDSHAGVIQRRNVLGTRDNKRGRPVAGDVTVEHAQRV